MKLQIEILLNYVIKTIKNEEARRSRYLIPLKCLLSYSVDAGLQDSFKMETVQEQEYKVCLKKQMGKYYTSSEKFIRFCRKILFLEVKEINWEANV